MVFLMLNWFFFSYARYRYFSWWVMWVTFVFSAALLSYRSGQFSYIRHYQKQIFDHFFMSLYMLALREITSTRVWNSGVFNPMVMATWAARSLEEYMRYYPCKKKACRRPKACWECPPSGRLKRFIGAGWTGSGGTWWVWKKD